MAGSRGQAARRPRGHVLATLAASLLIGALASPAATAAQPRFGFNDDPAHIDRAGNLLERSGARIARIPVHWPSVEPRPGEWHLASIDALYSRLTATGITPLFAVYGVPEHARDEVGGGLAEFALRESQPATQAWSRVWREFAGRYPSAVLQVFNEPNASIYGSIPATRMAELVNTAARAARSVNPAARILGPPAAPNGDWRPWFRQLYGSTDRSVGVAANIYPRVPTRWRADFRSDLRFVRSVAAGRPLWITETGLSRSQYGRRVQARGSAWIWRRAARARVKSVIFHRLIPRRDTTEWDVGLAATDFRTRPLPLFRALRKAVRRSAE